MRPTCQNTTSISLPSFSLSSLLIRRREKGGRRRRRHGGGEAARGRLGSSWAAGACICPWRGDSAAGRRPWRARRRGWRAARRTAETGCGGRRAGAASASVEEGIKALQLYSKEVSSRLLDFVKSRSAAAKAAAAAAPSEGDAPAASSESEVVDPQPAE
uniref:WPP domain-containing protein n=1 Tax=Oryza sativa subsp. japonica TaxID=39947 RepID=Q84YW5_ORYSJ|nr:unknown protein [Oryza sativa Japonica Group]